MVAEKAIFAYDGSFEGYLSAIFSIYERRIEAIDICNSNILVTDIFSAKIDVETNRQHAERVLHGLLSKAGKKIVTSLYRCFLSEQKGIEFNLYLIIQQILRGNSRHFFDYRNENVNNLHKVLKMIRREVHRMHAFVRFQELKDGTFAAVVEPDFNVLPLIGVHFENRYPAMEWLIFDTKRKYGIHYENLQTRFVGFNQIFTKIGVENLSDSEIKYQEMWQQYFKSVNISERINEKLHLRHVPKRYWKNLIEKQ